MLKNREFLREKSRGGTKLASLAPVILGLVPRILFQQGTSLVNKLALLLHKCWLKQDSRNKSENDWCWERGFSLVARKQRSVAVGSKVMDTRLPQPVGCGDKYDVSGLGYRLLRCARNDGASNGEELHRPWCHKILGTEPSMTGGRGANSFGRSMIEMLGVLAIIGVLSVGGIAGYSKAMEMYKMDKALEEYNFLIQGLMEHSEQFVKMSKQNTQMTGITDFVTAANLVPATWKKVTPYDFIDSVGNMVGTYIRGGLWAIEIHPGGSFRSNEAGTQINESFSLRMCESIFRDLAQPLHSSVHDAFIYRSKQGSIVFYGDKNCADGKKCLHNLAAAEINQTCKACQKSSERCSIAIEFE